MNIERFVSHHEARDALVLSVAGVTAIMLIESLILLVCIERSLKQQSRRRWAHRERMYGRSASADK